MFISVAVNIPTISGVFDYSIPPALEKDIHSGALVVVPFGKQVVQGIVVEQVEIPAVEETREITAVLDTLPALTPAQLELGAWISHNTLNPLAACLDAMLPPGISQHADTLYSLSEMPGADEQLTPLEKRILSLLKKRGPLRGRQIGHAIPKLDWKPSALRLVKQGWVTSSPLLPPPAVRPRYVRTAMYSASRETIEASRQFLGKEEAAQRRLAVLEFLQNEPLPVLVNWVYAATGSSMADLTLLAELGLVQLGETEVFRDPLDRYEITPLEPFDLTPAQDQVFGVVKQELAGRAAGRKGKPVLLHGVTGSGKTEIYLRAIDLALQAGRQVLMMVPEIALTPQTVHRVAGRFPGQVGLIHSRLSDGERYDTWRRARSGQLKIIIGPRSALFTPLPNLGLIIIDECHDEHFYQRDMLPYYSAVEAAIAYAGMTSSLILMGSATPDVSLYWRAQKETWHILTLPDRVLAHRKIIEKHRLEIATPPSRYTLDGDAASLPLPPVRVVDMREELKSGNRSIFSRSLQQALQDVLAAGQQAILYLNRRGASTYVFCRSCGFSLRCPRCSIPLVAHAGGKELHCHSCNYHRQMPDKCPQCQSKAIKQFGTGTEKLEAEVKQAFPGARVLRWDADTTRVKGSHDLILSYFSNHQADILVGTQMLAKGLDLPLVTLVGIVLADAGLNFPDYRTTERGYQLLTQVAGRAGRSPLGGQVILQTFDPSQPAIQAAARHDFMQFYREEIQARKRLGYPPFNRLVRLEYRHLNESKAQQEARQAAEKIRVWIAEGNYSATDLIGPVPCYFARVNGMYRWQVILRGPNPVEILREHPLADWRIEVDPPNLL